MRPEMDGSDFADEAGGHLMILALLLLLPPLLVDVEALVLLLVDFCFCFTTF
jgi:hypothetical protein